jgi:hypothetical protein
MTGFPTLDIGECIHGAEEGGVAAGNFLLDHPGQTFGVGSFALCTVATEGWGAPTCRALVGGALGFATGYNVGREMTQPCFPFWANEVPDMITIAAGALPGSLLDYVLRRVPPSAVGVTPLIHRLLNAQAQAPGLILELLRGGS